MKELIQQLFEEIGKYRIVVLKQLIPDGRPGLPSKEHTEYTLEKKHEN